MGKKLLFRSKWEPQLIYIMVFGFLRPWNCWQKKAINTAGMPISPGEAFRILFEVLASGFVLETGPGILDPCEKEACDALFGLSTQVREDVTAYAQVDVKRQHILLFFV